MKVDGIDGAGKTSLVARLVGLYRTANLRVIGTREFGSAESPAGNSAIAGVSQWLYESALDPALRFDDLERELAMMIACRRQNRIVLPKLRFEHDLIVSDRSSITNWAYGYNLGDRYFALLEWALRPVLQEDLILWIDIDPHRAFERERAAMENEHRKADIVEEKGVEYQVAVAAAYRAQMASMTNVIRLDGSVDQDRLLEEARSAVDDFLVT